MEFLEKIEIKDLKLGDVLLYNKATFIGRSIQICTRSHYNHASLYNGNGLVYEAVSPKFKTTPILESCKYSVDVIIQRPIFEFDPVILIKANESLIGKPYEYTAIYYEILRQLWGGWKGDTTMKLPFCSKAVGYGFNIATLYKLFEQYYQYTPDDLYKIRKYFQTFELNIQF